MEISARVRPHFIDEAMDVIFVLLAFPVAFLSYQTPYLGSKATFHVATSACIFAALSPLAIALVNQSHPSSSATLFQVATWRGGFRNMYALVWVVFISDLCLTLLGPKLAANVFYGTCSGQMFLISNAVLGNCLPKSMSIFLRVMIAGGNSLVFIFCLCSLTLFTTCKLAVLCLAGISTLTIFATLLYINAWEQRKSSTESHHKENLTLPFLYFIYMVTFWSILVSHRVQNFDAISSHEISAYIYMQVIPIVALPFLHPRTSPQVNHHSSDESLEEKKRSFVRFISHELRSHLGSMTDGLQQLLEFGKRWNDVASLGHGIITLDFVEIVKEVQESCASAERILDDILVYDRVRNSAQRLQRQLLDVKPFLKRSLEGVEQLMVKQCVDVTVRVDLTNEMTTNMAALQLHVCVDEVQQALCGVLESAVRASPNGEQVLVNCTATSANEDHAPPTAKAPKHLKTGEVTANAVVAEEEGEVVFEDPILGLVRMVPAGRLRVEVVDKGMGMTKESIAALLGDLGRSMDRRLHGGQASGLGLSISKTLITRNGGRFDVQSSGLGTGCTFVVELPLYCVQSVGGLQMTSGQPTTPTDTQLHLVRDMQLETRAATNFVEMRADDKNEVTKNGIAKGEKKEEEEERGNRSAPCVVIGVDGDGDIESRHPMAPTPCGVDQASASVPSPSPVQVAQSTWPLWNSFSGYSSTRFGGGTNMFTSGSFSLGDPLSLRRSFERVINSSRLRVTPTQLELPSARPNGADVVTPISVIIDSAKTSVQAHNVLLFLVDEMTGSLRPMASQDVETTTADTHCRAVVDYCYRSCIILNVPQCLNEERDRLSESEFSRAGLSTVSMVCVPIMGNNDKCLGVLQAVGKMMLLQFSRDDECELLVATKAMRSLIRHMRQSVNFESTIFHRHLSGDITDRANGCRRASLTLPVRRMLRFLVVDEMKMDTKMLHHALSRRLGHHVDTVSTGTQALKCVQQASSDLAPFDAIFISDTLHGMGGAELTREVLACGFKGRIIGCTSWADADVGAFNDVLMKPIPFERILKIVQELEVCIQPTGRTQSKDGHNDTRWLANSDAIDNAVSMSSLPASTYQTNHITSAPAPIEVLQAPAFVKQTVAHGKVQRCLVVDDVKSNRKVVRRLLEKLKQEVEEAEDGLEALQAVQVAQDLGQPFDFIFMDNVMPNLDGPGAARKLREQGFRGAIIGVTGNVLQSDVRHYLDHGANLVLGKPLRAAKVKEIMTEGYF